MRILLMTHAWLPNHCAGAEVMAHQMLRELARQGHEAHVLLSEVDPDFTEPYELEGVHVHPYRGKADPIEWITGDRRPDVILSHLQNTDRAVILGRMHRVPIAVLVHNDFIQTRNEVRGSDASLVIYNTEWMRDAFESTQPDLSRGVVVRPPVDPDEYRTTPGDCITLINLTIDKGAEVFYAMAERFPRRKFLAVVGGYGEQIIRTDLPNVELVEHCASTEVREKVYARTKILLVPSRYESYGRVAAEATCSGIPVIAAPTDGLIECLGEAGTYVPKADIDGWERELRRLLTPKGWAAASKKAKERIPHLDTSADLKRWTEAVLEVAERGRPSHY